MNSPSPHILAIHSMAVHGTASMKVLISLLGTQILPVPSLFLTGLTNMPGFERTQVDFSTLLMGSFELAEKTDQKLVVLIGYLGNAEQVAEIREALEKYQHLIEAVVVDPVSGDHGRTYVPSSVISAWPKLLEIADFALPNFTELGLYAGLQAVQTSPEAFLEAFHQRFPKAKVITTSYPAEAGVGVAMWEEGKPRLFSHRQVPASYAGSGDVFAAHFVHYHLLKHLPLAEAVTQAATQTLHIIEEAYQQKLPQLRFRLLD
ncbi:MAG: bifunctional hydroxymethylpyrimidine kinase/phosphomethylpyrimidine kinase [Bacteroidota bacterium]